MKSVPQSLKKRKEVSLDQETLNLLESQAYQEGRSLKNFLEHVLIQKANERELSDAYKARMDKYLEKKDKGEIKYQSQEEVELSLGIKL